jgi:hypothetical protein
MGFTHNCLQASCHTLHRQWFIDLCGCVTTVSISNTISPTIVVKEATTKLGSTKPANNNIMDLYGTDEGWTGHNLEE